MSVKKAKSQITIAMHHLMNLPCDLAPGNEMTRDQLQDDTELDAVSIIGQYAYLELKDALKEMENIV